jgi:transcription initiation factor TFIIE subunit alpha
MKDPVDLSKQLIRTVVRMFYETEHMVVIDALCYHNALTISDLVQILDAGKNSKHVGKLVGKLKEAGLCAVYTVQVMREGATKMSSREYYYIDYRRAADSIKYKVHKIDELVKKNAKPTAEKAELKCTRCKSQYTTMDVLSSIDPEPASDSSGFLCLRCGHPLTEIDSGGQVEDVADDTPAMFNKLFGPLVGIMAELDQMKIPDIEGKTAYDARIELPRDKNVDPGTRHEVVEMASRPTAVKGLDTGPEKVTIQIGSSAEQSQQQRDQERKRQEKISLQNQLPDWHTKSTVEKNANGTATAVKQEVDDTDAAGVKTEASDAKSATEDLASVFAQIEAERRRKEQEEEDDEEEEDDDEDEFEDVAVSTPSAVPDAKRVKLDTSAAPTPAASTGDGGDVSEEDEFEDVN